MTAKTPHLWCVSLFVLLSPSITGLLPFHTFGYHDSARIAEIVLLAASALLWLCNSPKKAPAGSAVLAVVAGIALLACASALTAAHRQQAVKELALYAGLCGVAMGVSREVSTRSLTSLTRVCALALLFYELLVLVVWLIARSQAEPARLNALFIGYDNYRFFNHAQTVAIPVAAIALADRRRVWVVVAWLSVTLGFVWIGYSMARSTGLALFVASVLAFSVLRRRSVPFLGLLVLAAAVGLIVGVLLTDPVDPGARQVSSLESTNARFYLWNIAAQHTVNSPWLGIGPAHFANHPNTEAAHPHNIYLQIAAECGVPMLLMLLGIAVWAVFKLGVYVNKCESKHAAFVGCGLFIACVAALVDGFFSGNFVMPVSQVWIALVAGCAIGWVRSGTHEATALSATSIRRIAGRGLILSFIASQILLLQWVVADVQNLEVVLEMAAEKALNRGAPPRFWSSGLF